MLVASLGMEKLSPNRLTSRESVHCPLVASYCSTLLRRFNTKSSRLPWIGAFEFSGSKNCWLLHIWLFLARAARERIVDAGEIFADDDGLAFPGCVGRTARRGHVQPSRPSRRPSAVNSRPSQSQG